MLIFEFHSLEWGGESLFWGDVPPNPGDPPVVGNEAWIRIPRDAEVWIRVPRA